MRQLLGNLATCVPNSADAIVDPTESDTDQDAPANVVEWALEAGSGRAPRRRIRHLTCYDAALAAVRRLTEADPQAEITIDEIETSNREAGHEWPRETIVKVVNRDLAGIGSGKSSPRSVPVLDRLSSKRFELRTQGSWP